MPYFILFIAFIGLYINLYFIMVLNLIRLELISIKLIKGFKLNKTKINKRL
jgi:hypothetical protein